ncbi:COPB2 [Acrasis kona]|uniref:Coatomer subunit beta' n=1 Tax=Acrasis kona TaxID=1008807 RepID=A0AAW2YIQ9_9EUKA
MPSARLNIKKKLTIRSERVKAVDLHPSEPWVLSSLYNGKVVITDYNTQAVVKEFDVSKDPVRAAKFIPRKRWVITGSDDNMIRIYNYNTSEKEKEFEAHQDYIRSIAVHPTKPYILTTSDDQTIKLWNWDRNWQCMQVYEGHHYFVMTAVWNPKDPNVFASGSLDGLIRVWSVGAPTPNYTLEGHTKGVNYIDFYHASDKPFLISGSDDGTVKIWDYQNKSVVQTLEGHSNNVTICCFHPKLPFIITGSEDHVVNIWNSTTYRLEETINSGLERVWAVGYASDTKLALGYDGGTVVLRLGKEVPVVSMDKKGKIIWALNHDIQQLAIKDKDQFQDGEKIALPSKELGTSDVYPQTMQHDPKGRFVSVCGEGEFVIYAAVSWRSKTYGNAEEIVWGTESGCYAIREKSGTIKVFKEFEMIKSFKPFFTPTGIFGGNLIGVKSREFIVLYDWDTCSLVRSIEVVPKSVHWNETGEYLSLCCEDCFYVLKYEQDLVKNLQKIPEDGVEDALQVESENNEKVKHGEWVGDAFVYVNNDNKLNYLLVGSETTTVATLDKVHFFLGFVSKQNRVYLMDKDRNVVSYALHVSVMQYETAIIRNDLEAAAQILQSIPSDLHNNLARFLHKNGHVELALSVSKDPEHQFELAVELEQLPRALEIATQSVDGAEQKWRQLGQVALSRCDFKLAEQCLSSGNDFSGLLLLYTSIGDKGGLEKLSQQCIASRKNNVAFICLFLLHKLQECIDLLVESNRLPEAALFARTYVPSRVSSVLQLWKNDLKKTSERASEALADPAEYENLFPNFDVARAAEEEFWNTKQEVLAKDYLSQKDSQEQVVE